MASLDEYTLKTLDQLEIMSIQSGSALNTSTLFYTLPFEPDRPGYSESAKALTLRSLSGSIKQLYGTSVDYNAGTDPNNVLLLPLDGKVPTGNLPVATGNTPGIISPGSNMEVTDGVIDIKSDLTGIESMTGTGTLELNYNNIIINGTPFGNISTINKIINCESTVINMANSNGSDPYYVVQINQNSEPVITVNTDNYEFNGCAAKINILVIVTSTPADNVLKIGDNWTLLLEANTRYNISATVLPADITGEIIVLPEITTEF